MVRLQLSIIISTWNSLQFLKPCLESIQQLAIESYEIILVDNSSDGTRQYVTSLKDERLRYVWTEDKLDWAEANQVGLELARGDWVCLSNPDILFNPDFR